MKNSCSILLLCSVLLCSYPVSAQSLLQGENVPGGVAVIGFNSESLPEVYYDDNRVMVIGKPYAWRIIVGIPLSARPGAHELSITAGQEHSHVQFYVHDKTYESQYITIEDKRKVTPTPVDMDRINREQDIIRTAKSTWTDNGNITLELSLPVNGPYSSPFGLRRFFNNQARKPHSGLDIVATEGTLIKAAAGGRIVNTGDYFFNGNTVFIDHGQGMLTMYCHLKSIAVKEGQDISRGDIIGTVGQTGRVTGAHLHWSVILNQAMVNPVHFISMTR